MFDQVITAVEQTANYDSGSIAAMLDSLIDQGSQAVMLLAVDHQEYLPELEPILANYHIKIFGGIYPSVVWQHHTLSSGILAVGLNTDIDYQLQPDISLKQTTKLNIAIKPSDTLLVFIDAFSSQIEASIHALFDAIGNTCTVIGAGAGSLSFKQKPCIITNNGIVADAMLFVSIPANTKLAISHGWQTIAGPFLATKVVKNRIKEINFKPAFDVYCEQIHQHTQIALTQDNFFQHAKSFPLGIDRLDDDMLVRDPIRVEGTDIICVGSVPENAMFYLLQGDELKLVCASANSVKQLTEKTELLFVVDCVSRKLFLQDKFELEVNQIKSGLPEHQHFIAVLALGEIASGKYGTINFHNKTSVIATISKH